MFFRHAPSGLRSERGTKYILIILRAEQNVSIASCETAGLLGTFARSLAPWVAAG
jgi:hypothetical protein